MGGSDLTYGSLFSGIGGIDFGMDLAGFNCAWQVEIDDYCREVLEEHCQKILKTAYYSAGAYYSKREQIGLTTGLRHYKLNKFLDEHGK